MTEIEYNGVHIVDVETENISQDQEYDEGNVDPLFIKTEISIIGTVHVLTTSPRIGIDVGSDLASGLATIERKLLEPRRQFVMKIHGSILYNIAPIAVEPGVTVPVAANLGNADVNNGPKTRIDILRIVGGKSAKVRMTFSLAIPNCNKTNIDGILSLRWWVVDDIDCSTWLTTRTYEGYIRLAGRNFSPHAFRNFVLPPLVSNFKRSRIHLAESESGLLLRFTVVDEEWHIVPPDPASDWDGEFTASSPRGNGAIWHADLTFTLKAPRNISKIVLHSVAKKILDAKIQLSTRRAAGQLLVENFAIKESLKSNRVSYGARVMYTAKVGEVSILSLVKSDLGDKPIEGISASQAANHFPTASMKGILLSALQTACSPAVMPKQTGLLTADNQAKESYQDDSDVLVVDEGQLEDGDTMIDLEGQLQNPITHYRATSDYHILSGRASLPTGKSSAGGATSHVVRLHRGRAIRSVRIQAHRMNKMPPMPDTSDFTDENGIQHTLLDWRPAPNNAAVSADGLKTMHSIDAEYIYALSRIPTSADSLSVGRLPQLKGLVTDQMVYPKDEYVTAESILTSKQQSVLKSG